jgi:hypothetical protein
MRLCGWRMQEDDRYQEGGEQCFSVQCELQLITMICSAQAALAVIVQLENARKLLFPSLRSRYVPQFRAHAVATHLFGRSAITSPFIPLFRHDLVVPSRIFTFLYRASASENCLLASEMCLTFTPFAACESGRQDHLAGHSSSVN